MQCKSAQMQNVALLSSIYLKYTAWNEFAVERVSDGTSFQWNEFEWDEFTMQQIYIFWDEFAWNKFTMERVNLIPPNTHLSDFINQYENNKHNIPRQNLENWLLKSKWRLAIIFY